MKAILYSKTWCDNINTTRCVGIALYIFICLIRQAFWEDRLPNESVKTQEEKVCLNIKINFHPLGNAINLCSSNNYTYIHHCILSRSTIITNMNSLKEQISVINIRNVTLLTYHTLNTTYIIMSKNIQSLFQQTFPYMVIWIQYIGKAVLVKTKTAYIP